MLLGAAITLGAAEAARGQVQASLRPEASVEVRYDDNVDRTESHREEDLIVTPRAGLTLLGRSTRFEGSIRYAIGTSYFLKDTEVDGDLEHDASLSVAYQAARHLSLRIADGFRISDTRRTDAEAALAFGPDAPPAASAPGSLPTRRVRETANTATLRAEWQAARFTTVDGEYSYQLTRYGDAELVDSDTHRASLGVDRQVSAVDRVGAAYTAALFTFDGEGPGDQWTHEPSLRWTHDFGAAWRGMAQAGASFSDVQGGSVRYSDVTGRLSVTGASRQARYLVSYERSVTTSGGTGRVDLTDRVLLGVNRGLTQDVTGDLGLGFARNEGLEGRSAATETFSATARLSVQLAALWSAFAAYSFERTDAPAELPSYRVNTVTVGVTWQLPGLGRAN